MEPFEPQKILIIRLSSIGDIVQSSGIPRHLKNKWPTSEIHWVVRQDNEELVKTNPHLKHVWSFDRNLKFRGWLTLCRNLSKENFTHVYDVHNNLRSHILCFYLRPKYFLRRSKNRIKRILLFVFKIDLFGADRIAS